MRSVEQNLFLWGDRILFVGAPPPGLTVNLPMASLLLSFDSEISAVVSGEELSGKGVLSVLFPPGCEFMIYGGQSLAYLILDPLGKDYYALGGRAYERVRGVKSIEDEVDFTDGVREYLISMARAETNRASGFFEGLIYGHPKSELKQVDRRVEKALQVIRDGICNNFSSQDIADRVHVSPSRLSYLFRRETGMPLRRYRQIHRVCRVIKARSQGASFTSSSFDFGFHDPAHFTRTFKKYFNIAPIQVSSSFKLNSDELN